MVENLQMIILILHEVMSLAILIRILLSWVPNVRMPFVILDTVKNITEPLYKIARKLPVRYGQFDFTPIVAFFILSFTTNIILSILTGNFV